MHAGLIGCRAPFRIESSASCKHLLMHGRDVDDDSASRRKALQEVLQLSRVGNEIGYTTVTVAFFDSVFSYFLV